MQQLASACTAAGIPESAVAAKLRTRGVDLQQLQARAAEVANGIEECANDEGWRLIQDGKLRLLYRHSAGSTVHCFKGSCLLPAPMNVSRCRRVAACLQDSYLSGRQSYHLQNTAASAAAVAAGMLCLQISGTSAALAGKHKIAKHTEHHHPFNIGKHVAVLCVQMLSRYHRCLPIIYTCVCRFQVLWAQHPCCYCCV